MISFGKLSATIIGNSADNQLTGSIYNDVLFGEIGDANCLGALVMTI